MKYTHKEIELLLSLQVYPIMTSYLNQAIEEEKVGMKGQVEEAVMSLSADYHEIMYQVPYEDLPLHINDNAWLIHSTITKWRLRIGK